jgi:hypothetical protein
MKAFTPFITFQIVTIRLTKTIIPAVTSVKTGIPSLLMVFISLNIANSSSGTGISGIKCDKKALFAWLFVTSSPEANMTTSGKRIPAKKILK